MSIYPIIIIMTFILKLVQVILFLASLVHTQPSQPCQAQWQLQQLIQFPQTLQITTPADQISEQYNVTFAGSYFQTPPRAIVSTPHLDVSSFTDIDYRIIPQVYNASATVTFLSKGMTWVSIKITLWLTSRKDMFVGTIVTENFQPNQSNNQTILQIETSSPVYFFQDNHTTYLNYINGMQAFSSSRVYEVNLNPASKSQTTYSLSISINPATTLTYLKVDYIIYNTQISLFSSGGGYYTSSNIVGPYYQKIHKTFLPIEYNFLGIQSIRISNQTKFKLDINIDEDNILQIAADRETPLSYGRIVYLTIGQKSVDVCAACPNLYISQKSKNCIAACPDNAYPFTNYTAGGKSCLTCSPKIFEMINPERTGCMCVPGYQKSVQGVCLSVSARGVISGGSSTSSSSSFSNTQSVTVSENITTTRTETTTSNSSNITTSIIINPITARNCTGNSVFQSDGTCFSCPPGFFQKDNIQCIPCMPNCQLCSSLTTCAQCLSRYTANSNRTQCVQSSVICQPGFYKVNQNCIQCPSGCAACSSAAICSACQSGFTFNSNNLTCTRPRQTSCPNNSVLTAEGQCVCDEFSMLYQNGCVRCVRGSFLNANKVCVTCEILNCQVCRTQFVCEQCVANFTLQNNGQCLYNLSSDTICNSTSVYNSQKSICIQCPGGSLKQGNTCQACPGEGCISCTTLEYCDHCAQGLILAESRKNCRCGSGQYYLNSACLPCVEGCVSCLNGQSCETCQNGWVYSKSENKCVVLTAVSCGSGQYYLNSACLPCVEGCVSCLNGQSCETCQNGWTYNKSENKCKQMSSCPAGGIFTNGVCVCTGDLVLKGSSCQSCPIGTYKNGNACANCIESCTMCQSNNTCSVCNGYLTFNADLIACECQLPNYNIEGSCGPCPPGTVYSQNTLRCVDPNSIGNNTQCQSNYYFEGNKCFPCMINCSRCVDNTSCAQCISPYQFSSEIMACVLPPQCPGQNQEFIGGQCVCNNRSVIKKNEDGNFSCHYCGNRLFPNVNKTQCESCSEQKCLVCYGLNTCDQCQEGYTGNDCRSCGVNYISVNGYCVPNYCGNGIIDKIKDKTDENCDDKNKQSGDGCSPVCQVENGYFCSYNTAINASQCTHLFNLTNSSITSSGIFLNFEDLNDKSNEISSPQILNGPPPSHIYQKADPENKQKKVFFLDYCGVLPPENVTILIQKSGMESAQYNLRYDLANMKQI